MALAAWITAAACGGADPATTGSPDTPSPPDEPSAAATLVDSPSPEGGVVKELVFGGAEVQVSIRCDRTGFEPFLFDDQGTWIGCQIRAGAEPGDPTGLTEPVLETGAGAAATPALTVPGPAHGVLVTCPGGVRPLWATPAMDVLACQ